MIEMQCGKNYIQFLSDFKQCDYERQELKDPEAD